MNLETVTAELRPRGAWEAADFGARLVRRDSAAIYRIWFAVTIPLLLLGLGTVLLSPLPVLGALVYWWLEPIADGPMLHVISRRLFGEQVDFRATLAAAPRLAWRNRIFWLSPYRFHFARSIAMPLTQLEGLMGKARRRRAAVVNRKIMNHGVALTASYQHLVLALYLGVVLIVYALVPPDYQDTLGASWLRQFWGDDGRLSAAIGLLVSYAVQTALEPWYVGSGFGLYVNCRTRMEAWDLEIAFRRLVQRRGGRLAQAAACVALVAIAALEPRGALAQKADIEKQKADEGVVIEFESYWSEPEVRALLDEVLANDALSVTREVETWKRIDGDEPDAADAETPGDLADMLAAMAGFVARTVELALWGLVAAAVVWAVLKAHDRLPQFRPAQGAVVRAPRTARSDRDIVEDELPADIAGAALTAATEGDTRRALSLLYRGSVRRAIGRYGLDLPASATEGMCLAAVARQADAAHAGYFRKLVGIWMSCAYGSSMPTVEVVQTLCTEWRRQHEAPS